MKPRKFTAPTARDAMQMVKHAMGPDALILSNSPVEGGVEIVAIAPEAVDALVAPTRDAAGVVPAISHPALSGAPGSAPARVPAAPAAPAAAGRDEVSTATWLRGLPSIRRREPARRQPTAALEEAPANPGRTEPVRVEPSLRAPESPARSPEPAAAEPPRAVRRTEIAAERHSDSERERQSEERDHLIRSMMDEIRAMKSMLVEQLGTLAWSDLARRDPVRMTMMRTLLCAGFSGQTSRKLTERMPPADSDEQGLRWLHAELNRNLDTVAADADIVDRGGVYALVGPTGAGKTTTAAKIAARCVVRHGADKLALVTTDSFRIGAHEQLRIYGKILGVAVHAVSDAADLQRVLSGLRGKHMVLIDTIGMSQRDRMVAEQASMLDGCGADVKRLLMVNATSTGDTLEDVVQAYRGAGLAGCVLTKVDEAAGLGPSMDVMVRHSLRLHFVANGQRVPEDLHLANRTYLIHRALRTPDAGSPWALGADELPLVAAAGGAVSRGQEHRLIDRTIDQAEGLRRMFAGRRRVCVTFVSGKGGVGRSSVVLNVAAALAQAGRDALVIDENAGASSLATGLASPPDLGSVIDGASPLEDAVVRLDHRGPTVVRASNAARMLRRAGTPSERSRIASVLEQAVRPYEFVLCDAPVGDAGSFTAWGLESQHIALVLTRATASITEGYGLLKHLRRSFGHRQFLVLVNRVSTEQEARTIFGNMSSLASGSLAASLVFAGYVPPDERLMHARQLRRIAVDAFPQCAAAGAFRAIAEGLQGLPVPRHGPDGDDSTEYARRVVSGIGTAARDDTHTDTTPSTANRSRGMS